MTSRLTTLFGALLLGGLTSSPALAGGGGGVFAEGLYMPKYGKFNTDPAPGGMGCLGFMGFGYSDGGFRIGGEGQWCRGRPGVGSGQGGVQVGWRTQGRFFLTAYSGLGLGGLTDRTGEDDYRAFYGYLKPAVGGGLSLGGIAIEGTLFANMPLNFVQWVGTGESRGIITPTVGLRVAVLFGDFRPRRVKDRQEEMSARFDRIEEERRLPPPGAERAVAVPEPVQPPPRDTAEEREQREVEETRIIVIREAGDDEGDEESSAPPLAIPVD